MKDLTPQKLAILNFIGTRPLFSPPSIREIMAACGYKSTNAVAEQLKSLERSGHMISEPKQARGRHLTSSGLAVIFANVCPRCHQLIVAGEEK